jgi:ParB-like chromosome segregation protein Spo0J
MGGRRTSKEELMQLEAMTEEGLTIREIAERLGRSEAGIRNLRYRKGLVRKAEDETKVLFQQRDELKSIVDTLLGQRTLLANEVDSLKKKKQKLEATINMDKIQLYGVLAQALVNLKQQRPDLFILTGQDQMVSLIRLFWGFITQ